LQRIGHVGLGYGNRVALFPLGQFQPLVQLLFKIAIAHLLEDVGVPYLADLEGFVTFGADDFVYEDVTFLIARVNIGLGI
jgi:hypothetical protein